MENLDLQLTAALLNDVFKPKNSVTTEYLEWQYHKNPAGSACIGYILEESNQISNYALIPKILKNNQGKKVKLGVGVDLAVSPKSRGTKWVKNKEQNQEQCHALKERKSQPSAELPTYSQFAAWRKENVEN